MRVVNTLLISILLSLAPLSLHAQSSKDNQAKAYYFVALEAFEAKQYDEVLASIKNVEDLLGSSNARLSALKVKTYFEQNKLDKAKAELDRFFSYQSSDEQGREMASYLRKINSAIELEKNSGALKSKFGIGMITIPAGSSMMGSNDGDADEQPIHRVTINAFKLMESEVTFAMWDACVAAGGCSHKPDDGAWGRGNRPVINVSWNDVTTEFVPWLNRATGQTFRLPSEAEWEYAARAGSTTQYSWGNDVGRNNANCDGCGSQWDDKQTAPVKSFRPNAFGLYDMHGNVWEWTQDCWNDSYSGAPSTGSAWQAGDCSRRVVRGGSWYNAPSGLRSAFRNWPSASVRSSSRGFRLAQDLQ
ncbi:SUMF1/EgtB/PvdO family nonheme iron enzyme [Rheinheimera baltica]|uniref:SUMF1/EgtB/PvdO family nonheme iron enzyme n=1 Tax=Rheinheimera baltica TaxID=67576 RepID=UPI000411946D|nr:SUMF1/EgtB/PvdO family nonheme iron enzyme [Rheinheimera baltica]